MNDDHDEQHPDDELAKKRKPRAKSVKKAMAAEPKPPRKPRAAKQTQIPGTERQDRIPALERLAVAYVEVRDERMQLTKAEVEAKGRLHDAMKEHKLAKYSCDSEDLDVEIVPAKEESVKVKRRHAETDDEEG